MSRFGMAEPEAFRWIQRAAMDHRLTMRQVAERVIEDSGSQPAADGDAGRSH